jgi:hypothetical protein
MLSDALFMLGFFIVWYVLMRFLLPALGIPTCMTGACQIRKPEMKAQKPGEKEL